MTRPGRTSTTWLYPNGAGSVSGVTKRLTASAYARLRTVDADAIELRVLGCLIEKQRTTPEAYPLSLNALRLACNQSTNRDPVVTFEEREIKAALDRLSN